VDVFEHKCNALVLSNFILHEVFLTQEKDLYGPDTCEDEGAESYGAHMDSYAPAVTRAARVSF